MITPILRFHDFTDEWRTVKLGDFAKFFKGSSISKEDIVGSGEHLAIRYGELYTIYNELISDVQSRTDLPPKTLVFSNKNDVIIPSSGETHLDIATASCIAKDGVAIGGDINIIRSPANGIFLAYYLKNKKRIEIARLAQGVSVVHLYSANLKELQVSLPGVAEQQKIADFLTAVDEKIVALEQKAERLQDYKRGMMQRIFSQQIRFTRPDGSNFPDWKASKLSQLLELRSERNQDNKLTEVFSVAKHAGVVNQVEHLGRSFSSSDISNYKTVLPFDVVYTKSPTSDFPYGIIKQNKLGRSGVVSVLYGVYIPKNQYVGYLLDSYFSVWQNTYNYLDPIVQKGAKNTINIGDKAALDGRPIGFPSDESEQQKIANFLTAIDTKIALTKSQVEKTKEFKKGLLQRMFV